MTFDDLQLNWKNQHLPSVPAPDESLDAIREHSRQFRRKIFFRDLREIGASLVNIAIFSFIASRASGGDAWGAWGMALASAVVALLFLGDRCLQARRRARAPRETLADDLYTALHDLDHQIWLLRNVAWWYLGPFNLGLFVWAVGLSWNAPLFLLLYVPGFGLIGGLVSVYIYRLNQRAVHTELFPERTTLAETLSEWNDARPE